MGVDYGRPPRKVARRVAKKAAPTSRRSRSPFARRRRPSRAPSSARGEPPRGGRRWRRSRSGGRARARKGRGTLIMSERAQTRGRSRRSRCRSRSGAARRNALSIDHYYSFYSRVRRNARSTERRAGRDTTLCCVNINTRRTVRIRLASRYAPHHDPFPPTAVSGWRTRPPRRSARPRSPPPRRGA